MKNVKYILIFLLMFASTFAQQTIRDYTYRPTLSGTDAVYIMSNTNVSYYGLVSGISDYTLTQIDFSSYVPKSTTLTLSGTTNQITVTGGTQNLSADRTWTVSLPNSIKMNYAYADSGIGAGGISKAGSYGLFLARNATMAEYLAAGSNRTVLYSPSPGAINYKWEVLGVVYDDTLNGGGGGGGTDTTKVPLTRELTIAGTTNQITVDDTTQDLSANRRWQIGLPNSVTLANNLTLTNGFITQSGGAENEFSGNIDLATGKVYKINNTSVLSSTTLGSTVVNSSLTSVGTIASGTWQGSAIGDSYISSAANWNDAYNKRVNTWNYPLSISSNTVSFGYNTTNLQLTSNQLNTIQNINTTASPTFANMNVGAGGAYRIDGVDKFSLNILTLGSTGNQGIINTSGSSVPLSLEPNGYLMISTGSGAILPWFNYTEDIGASFKKFRSIYAGELRVQNLVAEDVMSTIGGRIFVAPSTELIDSVTTGATSIKVKHNNLASGDRVVLENNGNLEWMAITSSGSAVGGGYSYSVTRNLDGTGANAWSKGDGVVSTGTTGDGFIDLYAQQGILGSSTGPTIVGNVRYGTTYNQLNEHWAIGNLNGVYGYATDTYGVGLGRYASTYNNVVIDPTNGIRFRNYATTIGSWNGSTITLGEVGASKSNIIISSGALKLRNNTTDLIVLNTDGTATFAGNITSTATITGGTLRTASTGRRIELSSTGTYTNKIAIYSDSGYTGSIYGGLLTSAEYEPSNPITLDGNVVVSGDFYVPVNKKIFMDASNNSYALNSDGLLIQQSLPFASTAGVLVSGIRIPRIADTDADNNSIYYSTTKNKLVYKNNSGNISSFNLTAE